MPVQQWIIVAVAVVAVVALVAVALLAAQLRRTRAEVREAVGRWQGDRAVSAETRGAAQASRDGGGTADTDTRVGGPVAVLTSLPPRHEVGVGGGRPVVTREGRTIELPTNEQVVRATMRRPLVRGAVLSHGLWHALRPENRDRVRALVRREYQRRRKIRRRAGRRAARTASIPPSEAQAWLGSRTRQDGTS